MEQDVTLGQVIDLTEEDPTEEAATPFIDLTDNASTPITDITESRERLAAKTTFASDILRNVTESAQKLSKLDVRLSRYLAQTRLLLVWKQGSGAVNMAGSAAKTVGSLMILAAPLHPSINTGLKIAHKLYKLGASLKILNAIANILRDVWQKGCRSVLLEFTHCTAVLTRNLSMFGEVLRDLQTYIPGSQSPEANSPLVIFEVIREFIPPHQIPYATHVINMAFGNERYSPLFAFTSLTQGAAETSSVAQIMYEMESFHFDEFIETSESRALVAIGTFLHISKELFDFMNGFKNLSDQDCHFLQECMQRFSQESEGIMKAVSVLVSLDRIRKQLNQTAEAKSVARDAAISLYNTRDVGTDADQPQSRVVAVNNIPLVNHMLESVSAEPTQDSVPIDPAVNIPQVNYVSAETTEDPVPKEPAVQVQKRALVSSISTSVSSVIGKGGNLLSSAASVPQALWSWRRTGQ